MNHIVFCERMKMARKELKLTQVQVSEKLQINRTSISGFENGNLEPNMEQLTKLALLYDVTTDWLLGIDKNSKKE